MTMWFGTSWGAPINEGQHVLTPVGEPCLACEVPIAPEDRGVVMPYVHSRPEALPVLLPGEDPPEYGEPYEVTLEPFHLRCYLRDGLGPLGDQLMDRLEGWP